MQRSVIALIAAVALLQACATGNDMVDYTADGGAELGSAPSDRAQVIFYRPSLFGGMVSGAVYEDDEFLSIVMADSQLVSLRGGRPQARGMACAFQPRSSAARS